VVHICTTCCNIIMSYNTVTYKGVRGTNNNGSMSDDWIYWPFFVQSLLITSNTTRTYKPYSAIADLHTFQFTAAHALGISVSTSRCLIADLNTGNITSNHYAGFLSFLLQSPSNAGPIIQFYFSSLCTARYYSELKTNLRVSNSLLLTLLRYSLVSSNYFH
jgi:hypothetical protein